MYHAKRLQYTDSHDVVYAFLGHPTARLGTGENETSLIPIDYSKSIPELYTELSIKGLVGLHNPLVLSLVSHQNASLNTKFPSWVCDLSHREDQTVLLGFSIHAYRAGTGREMKVSVSNCNTKLFVRGVIFDEVVGCRREFAPLGPYGSSNKADCMVDTLDLIRSHAGNKASVYDGVSADLIASLILTCGLNDGTRAEENLLRHFRNFYAYCEYKGFDRFALPSEVDGVSKKELAKQGDSFQFAADYEFVYGKKVFRTQRGYFGLGPHLMEYGDKICVLFGFPTPFILRRVNEHYLLIGECYAQGIMDGELVGKWRSGIAEFEEMDFEIH